MKLRVFSIQLSISIMPLNTPAVMGIEWLLGAFASWYDIIEWFVYIYIHVYVRIGYGVCVCVCVCEW